MFNIHVCTADSEPRLQASTTNIAQWPKENDMRLNPKEKGDAGIFLKSAENPPNVTYMPNIPGCIAGVNKRQGTVL